MRPGKESYYLGIAIAVARRSTCLRRQYGAIIVKNDEIIATGYNGAPRGESHCCDTGVCWREAHNVPHGEQYEKCVSVHAEQNAIISAARSEMIDSTMYLVGIEDGNVIPGVPCDICRRMIRNAGIKTIVTIGEDLENE
jgi:dCMP deaminase